VEEGGVQPVLVTLPHFEGSALYDPVASISGGCQGQQGTHRQRQRCCPSANKDTEVPAEH